MKRARIVAALGVGIALLVVATLDDPDSTPEGPPLLPDLWSSAPFELQTALLDERHVIRFTTEINNQGAGAFLVGGNTRSGSFTQRFAHADGGHSEVPVDVTPVWGGDTHFHWHIAGVARYSIEREDGGPVDGSTDNKVGFCFFDGVDRLSGRADAPSEPVHEESGCGGRLDLDLAMGLSVGWGDQYRFDLRGQFIDIENLAAGRYLLVATVDPDGRFVESDTTNNTAATAFALEIDTSGNRTLVVDP